MTDVRVDRRSGQVDLDDAIARVATVAARPVRAEAAELRHAAGRVLASDLASLADVPACDVAAMDGFACRYDDTLTAAPGAPTRLRLVGEAAAGARYPAVLASGEAVAVSTGAPMPQGADAVARVETAAASGGVVTIEERARVRDVRRMGDQLALGETYLRAGTHLTPRSVGLAAAMGHAHLPVVVRPRVAVLVTGNELVEPGEALPFGHAFNANGAAIATLVARAGGEVAAIRRVPDDPEALRRAIEEERGADLVITTGGASVGRHDVVRQLLETTGAVAFSGVRMKPGGPVTLGAVGPTTVLALPGNPAAAWIVFQVLGTVWFHRRLDRLDPPPYLARSAARAGSPFPHGGGRTAFWPARLAGHGVDGLHRVEPVGGNGGVGPAGVARSDVLVVTRPWQEVEAGAVVEVVGWS